MHSSYVANTIYTYAYSNSIALLANTVSFKSSLLILVNRLVKAMNMLTNSNNVCDIRLYIM